MFEFIMWFFIVTVAIAFGWSLHAGIHNANEAERLIEKQLSDQERMQKYEDEDDLPY